MSYWIGEFVYVFTHGGVFACIPFLFSLCLSMTCVAFCVYIGFGSPRRKGAWGRGTRDVFRRIFAFIISLLIGLAIACVPLIFSVPSIPDAALKLRLEEEKSRSRLLSTSKTEFEERHGKDAKPYDVYEYAEELLSFVEDNCFYPEAYLIKYDSVWGELTEQEGDIVWDTLSRRQQLLVNYPIINPMHVYVVAGRNTYHSIDWCYTLFKSYNIQDVKLAAGMEPCSKCVESIAH